MKLFDVFDKNKKVAEIYEAETDCGIGTPLKFIGIFILLGSIVFVIPIFISVFFAKSTTDIEKIGMGIYASMFLIVSVVMIICGIKKKKKFSGNLGNMILIKNFAITPLYYIILLAVDGYQFGCLIMLSFLTFIISINTSLICSLIVSVINKIQKGGGKK